MASIQDKPFWVRIALLGFGLYVALVLTFFVVTLINGEGDAVIFAIISGIPALIAIGLLLRFTTWAYVVSGLLALIGIFFFAPGVPVSLSTPDSFFDFISTTVGIVGLIIALVGCVVSFFQSRSGNLAANGPPAAVLAVRTVLALMLISGVISAVLTIANKETVSAADKKDAIIVTADKSEWSTDTIETSSSGTLRLVLKNSDPYLHTFTSKDLNMDFKLKPGSEQLIVLKQPLAGSHEFMCTIHTEMKGTIEVR